MHRHGLMAGIILAAVLAMGSLASAADGGGEVELTVRQGAVSMTEVYFAVGLAAAAAVTAAVSILGAGFAVGKIGAAALGSAAEHPELLTRSLLFVALAEGLAVLGFAVAMLIVMKIP